MKNEQEDCRARQEELAFAAGRHPFGPLLTDHLSRCATCRSFAKSVKELSLGLSAQRDRIETDADLVTRTMNRLKPELAKRSGEKFRLRARLALAGLVSLPVILGLNGVLLWFVYSTLHVRLSETVAAVAAYLIAASTLLGLSLAYGSLPLLADWGLKLRHMPALSRARLATADGSAE
jgi:predicted anti-sigma-YlaC factor YlaD